MIEGSHNIWNYLGGWEYWISENKMKTPSIYWDITIFSNFDVRVGEKCQFFSDSEKHEFWYKMWEHVWYYRAFSEAQELILLGEGKGGA